MSVNLQLELGPKLSFKYPVSDTVKTLVNQVRDAMPSPDGKRLAFTALDRLYVMDYPNGMPKRITTSDFIEAQPCWSRDGKSIVFITWTARGGDLVKVNTTGPAVLQKLNKEPGLFLNPVFNNEGDKIVFERSQKEQFKESFGPGFNTSGNQICWIPAAGGAITVIDNSRDRYNPHFVKGKDLIFPNNGNGDLLSVQWNGTDEKVIAHVTGITPYGFSVPHSKYGPVADDCLLAEAAATEPDNRPSKAEQVTLSPLGDRAFAQIANELYVVDIPKPVRRSTYPWQTFQEQHFRQGS